MIRERHHHRGSGRVPVPAVAALLVGGLVLVACGSGGDGRLPVQDVTWDGERFVVHDNAHDSDVIGEGSSHWTSVDGLDWERHPGSTRAGLPRFCFDRPGCGAEPEGIEEVPFHFATPQSQELARVGDVTVVEARVRYSIAGEHDDSSPGQVIHPALLARAARDSACFRAVSQAQRRGGAGDAPLTADEPFISSWGQGDVDRLGAGDLPFTVTCTDGDATDTFSLSLREVLSKDELDLVSGGSEPQLFVNGPDGEATRLADPPVSIWVDDTGVERESHVVVATASRFWAIDRGELVSSVDGQTWEPVVVETEGRSVGAVVTNPGHDLVLVLDDRRLVASHDEGRTWHAPIPVEGLVLSWGVVEVGPGSAAVVLDRELVIVDTATGQARFSIDDRLPGLLVDVGIGPETVVVPNVVSEPDGRDTGVFEVYDLDGELVATVS